MIRRSQLLWHVLIVILLTLITQIGGVVYLMSRVFCKRIKVSFPLKGLLAFILIYSIGTFITTPMLARLFKRERVQQQVNLQPANYLTVLLNRNYVSEELNSYLQEVSVDLAKRNSAVVMRYLDAGFPLIPGFPLLPHLSHADGNKIDLSLVYEDEAGQIINASKSYSGYGVFEAPRLGEVNQYKACVTAGASFYNLPQYLTMGRINGSLRFSEQGTRDLLKALLANRVVEKVFLEPHLIERLQLQSAKIRFQGCHSVRHDDHIHVQIR